MGGEDRCHHHFYERVHISTFLPGSVGLIRAVSSRSVTRTSWRNWEMCSHKVVCGVSCAFYTFRSAHCCIVVFVVVVVWCEGLGAATNGGGILEVAFAILDLAAYFAFVAVRRRTGVWQHLRLNRYRDCWGRRGIGRMVMLLIHEEVRMSG